MKIWKNIFFQLLILKNAYLKNGKLETIENLKKNQKFEKLKIRTNRVWTNKKFGSKFEKSEQFQTIRFYTTFSKIRNLKKLNIWRNLKFEKAERFKELNFERENS